ncbi:hypothetical protein PNOK_0645500 [Pyrrhoderma noxium]|uniref:DUF6533 domain-containing protein n=1 Tax=Pyrrhoderma noxium TaxID=2282107 RepID=A0A286UEM8_9AGAM|nr:hypothetical protein PNOK_0645500 [Pyrrhoderma noxium]
MNEEAQTVKYIIVSLISLYIYDIILRLPKEVRLLWRPFTKKEFRRNLQTETSRVLFFFSQYSLIIFCILMLNYLFPGDSRDANTKRLLRCQQLFVSLSTLDISNELLATGLALYRLHTLWRLKKGQTVLLVTCFFVVVCVTCIVTIITIISEKKSVIFVKNIGVCVESTPKRSFVGSFIVLLILDVVGLALFITNGLHRPRRSTDNFTKILYRDGLQLFLSLLVILTFAPIRFQNFGAVTSVICVTIVCLRSYLNFVELEPSLNGSNIPLTLNP